MLIGCLQCVCIVGEYGNVSAWSNKIVPKLVLELGVSRGCLGVSVG